MTSDLGVKAVLLGIEAGATRTRALLVDTDHRVIERIERDGMNLKHLDDADLRARLREIRDALPQPGAIGIGMAGARGTADFARLSAALEAVWPAIPYRATHDLEIALRATERDYGETSVPKAQILVLSGTGSCCYGRRGEGDVAFRVGGWGHLLGDRGSGYEIGHHLLRAVIVSYDRTGHWSALGGRILRSRQLNDPEGLIDWAQTASKGAVAGLAPLAFEGWEEGDTLATPIVEEAAENLVSDAVACAERLGREIEPHFVLAGGNLVRQPRFAARVIEGLGRHWIGARADVLRHEAAWGAIALAREAYESNATPRAPGCESTSPRSALTRAPASGCDPKPPWHPENLERSPTEQRNPRSKELDRMSISEAIALMLEEEGHVPTALLKEREKLGWVVERISESFRKGGRLFYVGAGTSGRLGVLDASECPPTFRSPPEQVQGIIAGGYEALWRPSEGAEDDPSAGAAAIGFRGITASDIIIGIAASGRTPFVWGALWEAKQRGATTILLCFNPSLEVDPSDQPDSIIAPDLGPEVLTGSTRLKCGTATKLVLNLFTTLSMVRSGKALSNWMVDLNPASEKLKARAVRIVSDLTGLAEPEARELLEAHGWSIRAAYDAGRG